MTNRRAVIVGGCAAALALTGCSLSTQPDEYGLQYGAGPVESTSFAACAAPSEREYIGVFDESYTYPAGQRTYAFTGGEGAESDPLTVVSSDNIELTISGVLTFQLNGDCDTLRAFHEQIGKKYAAYNDGGSTSAGWDKMLDVYIGQPLQRALQVSAQGFDWQALYNDPKTRDQFEQAVRDTLPDYVAGQAETDDFFRNFGITLQKPQPPRQLVDQFRDQQVAREQLNTVNSRQAALDAERAQIGQLVQTLGVEGYIWFRNLQNCEDGDDATTCVPFLPLPAGSDLNVTPGGVR